MKHPDHIRRAQRIALFCKEIKRALLHLCVDRNISTTNVDEFIDGFAVSMEFSEDDFDNVTLLRMLLDEDFVRSTFDTFAEKS